MSYKQDFVSLMLGAGALKFVEEGEELFTLKSGRQSPFFMNAGAFSTGGQLMVLASCYAEAIVDHFGMYSFDVLFGPAYKGIPLAAVTALELARKYGWEVRYCANRKEIKDHGDKGNLLGTKLQNGDRILIIEDVTTSGASIDEVMPIINGTDIEVTVIGEIVSLDRAEKSKDSDNSALSEIARKYKMRTAAIATMPEVMDILRRSQRITDAQLKAVHHYYVQYGANGYPGI